MLSEKRLSRKPCALHVQRSLQVLTYKKAPFHIVKPGVMAVGGDITKFNGSGAGAGANHTVTLIHGS